MSNWPAFLLSFVIAGLVSLAIYTVYIQMQDRSVAATQLRAARTAEVGLLGIVEIDFANIGSNHPGSPGLPAFELHPDSAIISLGFESPDSVFRFWAQDVRGAPPVIFEYKWRPTGTIETERGIVSVYSLSRYVDGELSGNSTGQVTRFSVDLLDSNGAPVFSNDLTRQVQVGISIISNLGANDYVEESHLNTIVRPQALARLDYEDYLPS